MKSFTLLVVCAILFAAVSALAQQTPSPSSPVEKTASAPVFPSGMLIPVVLQNNLDSKKLKPGDAVKLELASAIKGPDGKIAIPDTAKLFGRVTEAVGRGKTQSESRLAIVVERMEWKNGNMALHAVFAAPKRSAQDTAVADGRRGAASAIVTVRGSQERPPAPAQSQLAGSGSSGEPSPFEDTSVENSADPQIGTVLVSKTRNIMLPMGTRMMIMQTAPAR